MWNVGVKRESILKSIATLDLVQLNNRAEFTYPVIKWVLLAHHATIQAARMLW